MLCRWNAGTWTSVIVAIVVAISAWSDPHSRTPVVTFEEAVR